MEAIIRKPFQGIGNIIRFNWHFYALALVALVFLHLVKTISSAAFHPFIGIAGLLLITSVAVSLAVSFYVYDLSGLYRFDWLKLSLPAKASIVNIHAGFDETSSLLQQKFRLASLTVLDFYDAKKHTEISIKRARKAYPSYPGTRTIGTDAVHLPPDSIDAAFCILSAHEIRDGVERCHFFEQLKTGLKNEGRLVVVEHLRNLPNFLAYNIGVFHFHSAAQWKRTFASAGLRIQTEQRITPFITAYYLIKNGTTP